MSVMAGRRARAQKMKKKLNTDVASAAMPTKEPKAKPPGGVKKRPTPPATSAHISE